jgi:hypothetical protein
MKTSRTPKSREQLQRVILRMADSAQGLTWRRLHDAVATDDQLLRWGMNARLKARIIMAGGVDTAPLMTWNVEDGWREWAHPKDRVTT